MKKLTYLQFRELCSAKLKDWGMYSPEAVELLAMMCAHESLGTRYRRQVGGGPARGIFQIEIRTHDSIWDNSDTIKARARKFGITRNVDQLEKSDEYSIFMARHYLAMDKRRLPKTPEQMAEYAKGYWNGAGFNADGTAKKGGGKAEPEEYLRDWNLWKEGKI
jgi:hypothetical protein